MSVQERRTQNPVELSLNCSYSYLVLSTDSQYFAYCHLSFDMHYQLDVVVMQSSALAAMSNTYLNSFGMESLHIHRNLMMMSCGCHGINVDSLKSEMGIISMHFL
jgi:hypothetical protein